MNLFTANTSYGKEKRSDEKWITGTIILFLTFLTMSMTVKADGYTCSHGYRTFGDHVLNGGVGNYGSFHRYYWVSNLNNTYRNYTAKAVNDWVNTTSVYTSISIMGTTVQADSSFDVYGEYLGASVFGSTSFWNYNTQINLNSNGALPQNYGWTKIKINTSALSNITAAQRKATIAHEFGHAMGLSHRNNKPGSIMCQYGSG